MSGFSPPGQTLSARHFPEVPSHFSPTPHSQGLSAQRFLSQRLINEVEQFAVAAQRDEAVPQSASTKQGTQRPVVTSHLSTPGHGFLASQVGAQQPAVQVSPLAQSLKFAQGLSVPQTPVFSGVCSVVPPSLVDFSVSVTV